MNGACGTLSATGPASIGEVIDELRELLARDFTGAGGESVLSDAAFDRLALRVHRAQRASNPVLRRYWDRSAPAEPSAWNEIPPVPVQAFRDVPIIAGTAEAVFRTSGTTGGDTRRGDHHVASVELYRAAARANYRHHLFAGASALTIISLIPSPALVTDSSLSAMAGFIAREPEVAHATWALDPDHGVDIDAVREAVERAGTGHPILLLTTSIALVHLLGALGREPLLLPPASRIMETGGFKGRAAEVDRSTLYGRVGRTLGVPGSRIVNEYGMTEMLSQAYDCVAGEGAPVRERVHRFPPWVRTRALDPADLSPLPAGQPGLLAHFDLANAASVCHLLTEDYGRTAGDGGVRLLGRAPGAALRGCSLTAESFLRATTRGRA